MPDDSDDYQARGTRLRAVDWLEAGERWPAGRLSDGAPLWAAHAVALARNLEDVLARGGWSPGDLAEAAMVAADDVAALLAGASGATVYEIAQIENAVAAQIWPTHQDLTRARERRA